MKDGHVNDAAQGVVEDVPQDVAQDLGKRMPLYLATSMAPYSAFGFLIKSA